MGSPLFYISQFVHKTRLEVDERVLSRPRRRAVIMAGRFRRCDEAETKVLGLQPSLCRHHCRFLYSAVLFEGVVSSHEPVLHCWNGRAPRSTHNSPNCVLGPLRGGWALDGKWTLHLRVSDDPGVKELLPTIRHPR